VARNPVTHFLCFVNEVPQAGEPKRYCANAVAPSGYVTYGLVTFLPNLQYAGNVLILEGTTGAGTEAAGDFITDPHFTSHLRAILGLTSRAASLPYFEILLKTTVLDNTPGKLEVVARKTLGWPSH
jgi:hypothetical protein